MNATKRALTVLPITCLLALAGSACTKKEEPKTSGGAASGAAAGESAGESAGADGGPGQAKVTRVAGDVNLPGSARLAHEPLVLGHFAFPNASALLASVRAQLVVPRFQGMVDEAAVRSLVALSLDKRSQLAMNFDLATPMGCAVVDVKSYEVPLACTFGYRGGVDQLVKDLGKEGLKGDAGGHALAYTVDGKDVFIDKLGEHLAVTAHADLFDRTKGYLEANIVGRAGSMAGDFEAVAYLDQIWNNYRSDIEPVLNMAAASSSMPERTGNEQLDAVVRRWSDYSAQSTKEGLKRFGQYEQVAVYLQVNPTGVILGGTAVPAAGSEAATEAKLYGGRAVDPAFVEGMPSGPVMLVAMNSDPAAMDAASTKQIRDLAIDTWADLTKQSADEGRAAIGKWAEESRRLYDGQGAFALLHQQGAPFSLVFSQRLNPGASARDGWKAWSADFTPEKVLGKEIGKMVQWTFTADAASVDGVPVDRWVIEPGPEMKAEIEKNMSESDKADVERYFGPIRLTIDRAEVGGAVIYTVAPKAEDAAMARAIAARKGQGSLAGDAGLGSVTGRSKNAAAVVAVDVRALLDWLRSYPQVAEELKKMPGVLGTNLADFYMVSYYLDNGTASFEYVVTQQMIDQIKVLVEKLDQ